MDITNRTHITLSRIATLGPVGYFPVAPGTFGTVVALLILFLLRPTFPAMLVMTIAAFVLGIFSSSSAEAVLGKDDPGQVVIDEVVGYFVTMLFFETDSMRNLLIAFVLFRALDIIKPPPIRFIEKKFRGGLGIMLDDIVAGIFSAILLLACNELLNRL